MAKELFGKTVNGEEVYLYTLSNQKGMTVKVMNYGAILVNVCVPDKNGEIKDVVLGYDKLEDYFVNSCFFGAVIAPNANRIGNASFTLNGRKYQLDVNDGPNNLHSHRELGGHKRVWEAEEGDHAVTFSVKIQDGEMGFPGNKTLKITYTLTEENELCLEYEGSSDEDTVLNMTNHCYFNLDGHDAGQITSHTMQLFADYYTPADAGSIPTGEIASVEGTPMDFRVPHVIGDRIDADFEQLNFAGGYDHNWVLNGYDGKVRKVAVAANASASRVMEVYTDLPGVQFYAGNFIEKEYGKDHAVYGKRSGFCLETQFYPDAPNKPAFPSSVFGPDRPYHTKTIFKFIV